ncbi:TlpA disulfide reductase family protein [Aquimarina sp. 2201CG5-10]|uniref:TlpA family protein disulfide reductase n=1 Tax=Aquimarina callyspongiae TaxID=3098150 RepID=UPI002AB36700|nr:TlpA disulfide reductase family protein [Aquimarina sp. 2201CG5-10]MDY8138217.1 TlpA disulfide reductase family protein [Aquimarina sp. 2201CG5-10]
MKSSLVSILLGLITIIVINVLIFLLLREIRLIYNFSILQWVPILSSVISFYVAGCINKKTPDKLLVFLLVALLVFKPFRYFYFPFVITLLLFAVGSLSLTRKAIARKYRFGIGGGMLIIFMIYLFAQPLIIRQKGFYENPDGSLENAMVVWGEIPGEKRHLPSVGFIDVNNQKVKLNQFEGKVLYVSFWATWCAPCLREKPVLDQMKTKFSNKENIVFIDVSINRNRQKWLHYLDKNNVKGIQLHTNGNEVQVMQVFNFSGLPYHIIITPDGKYTQSNDLSLSEQFLNKF